MPTIEDGIREYNKFRAGGSIENLRNAKGYFEYTKKEYSSVTDMELLEELLAEVNRKLSIIKA